ncbi:MAG TPA: hypothetical protein VGB30_00800 [bacterium]
MKGRIDIFHILLLLIPCAMFFPELIGYSQFAGWDVTRLNLPLKWYDVEMVRDGHFPIWNHYMYTGMPQFAESESGLLYPGNWLMHLPGNFFYWANLTYIIHFILAGQFMYLWLRGRGTNQIGAFFGAVMFQTAPFLLFHITSMALLQSVVWFPLFLWLCDRMIENPGEKLAMKSLGIIAIVAGFVFLAGNAQIFFYMFVLVIFYLAGHVFSENPSRINRLKKSAAIIGSFIGGTMVIGAPLLFAVLGYLPETARAGISNSFYYLGTWLNPLRLGSAYYFPSYGEPTEVVHWGSSLIYVGLLCSVLATLRIFTIRKNWKADAPLIIMGLAALILAFAMYNPLWHLLIKLPLLDKFRYIGRFAIGVVVVLSALGASHLSSLTDTENPIKINWRHFSWISGILMFLLVIFLLTIDNSRAIRWGGTIFLIDMVIALMVIGGLARPEFPVMTKLTLGLYIFFHLFIMFPVGRLATMPMEKYSRITNEFFSHITRDDNVPPRLLVTEAKLFDEIDILDFNMFTPQDHLPDLCSGNTPIMFGVQTMDPYTPLPPAQWNEAIRGEIIPAFKSSAETGILDDETAFRLEQYGIDYVVTGEYINEIPNYEEMDVDLTGAFGEGRKLFKWSGNDPLERTDMHGNTGSSYNFKGNDS